jgi:hypothetical protein
MRKIILTHGLIAGVIVSLMILGSIPLWKRGILNFDNSEIVGYTTIVVAMSMVFFGIKSCRDYHFGGSISFWQGVKVGLMITLIGSVMYAVAWEVSQTLMPDFSDRMWEHFADEAKNKAKDEAELKATVQQMETWKGLYKNPLMRFGITLTEIAPIGILITIISAAILRRKQVLSGDVSR